MSDYLPFIVVGVTAGSLYGLAGMGLVLAYKTSGIFNFAHGAIGMLMAFLYWELSVNQGWPVPIALIVVVTLDWLPISIASFLAAGALVGTRCISAAAARRSVDWSILILIGSAIGVAGISPDDHS